MALHSSGGAIQRALSCDSVTSEASVADFDNADEVNNKIGQLEFSVQYLRYVASIEISTIDKIDILQGLWSRPPVCRAGGAMRSDSIELADSIAGRTYVLLPRIDLKGRYTVYP